MLAKAIGSHSTPLPKDFFRKIRGEWGKAGGFFSTSCEDIADHNSLRLSTASQVFTCLALDHPSSSLLIREIWGAEELCNIPPGEENSTAVGVF